MINYYFSFFEKENDKIKCFLDQKQIDLIKIITNLFNCKIEISELEKFLFENELGLFFEPMTILVEQFRIEHTTKISENPKVEISEEPKVENDTFINNKEIFSTLKLINNVNIPLPSINFVKVAKDLFIIESKKAKEYKIAYYLAEVEKNIGKFLINGKYHGHFSLDEFIVTPDLICEIIKILEHNKLKTKIIEKTTEKWVFEISWDN